MSEASTIPPVDQPEPQATVATTVVAEVDLSTLTRAELVQLATTRHGIVLKGNASKATILAALAKATSSGPGGATYVVLINLSHDNELYLVGEEIELTSNHALPLLAKKIIGVAV